MTRLAAAALADGRAWNDTGAAIACALIAIGVFTIILLTRRRNR